MKAFAKKLAKCEILFIIYKHTSASPINLVSKYFTEVNKPQLHRHTHTHAHNYKSELHGEQVPAIAEIPDKMHILYIKNKFQIALIAAFLPPVTGTYLQQKHEQTTATFNVADYSAELLHIK